MRFILLTGSFLVFLAGPQAWGNIGPPSSGGQVVAEPIGIQDVEITHETLSIDLRPLASGGHVEVNVVYDLTNHGDEKSLDLLFVSGAAGMNNFQVRLGDQSITSHPVDTSPIPSSWQAPKETPSLQINQTLSYLAYARQAAVPYGFSVVVPHGQQTLSVKYFAEAATHRYGSPTVYRQFAYILAPARSWSAFGKLDITIHLPPDWRAACTPALSRVHDSLTGTFTEIPADAIALTVQAPEGFAYRVASQASIWIFTFVIILSLLLCWRVGLASGRRLSSSTDGNRSDRKRTWPRSLAAGTISGILVFGTGILAIQVPDMLLPPGQVNHDGYGQVLAIVGVIMISQLMVPVGFIVSQVTARSFKKEGL